MTFVSDRMARPPRARRGSARERRGKFYARVRFGAGGRLSTPLPWATSLDEAEARAGMIAEVANLLIAAGKPEHVKRCAKMMADAKTPKRVDSVLAFVRGAAAGEIPLETPREGITVRQWAERWISGELHAKWPDYVPKKKSVRGDRAILKRYIGPRVGHVPLVDFTLEHAEAVMGELPTSLASTMRRHVAQVMHRLFKIAVFPGRLLTLSPFPPGFLPKIKGRKAFSYLYPSEDAQLVSCTRVNDAGEHLVPLQARLFYGVDAREGMRATELLEIEWADLDLERGAIALDENKTNDPRAWALSPDVAEALRRWATLQGVEKNVDARGSARVFPDMRGHHIAKSFRRHLEDAGIDRAELFKRSLTRHPIRIHDLRATFVTTSLANGKSESWVSDRTGHKSSTMIRKYKRAVSKVVELNLGTLVPLHTAIPELRVSGDMMGPGPRKTNAREAEAAAMNGRKNARGGPSGGRTRMSLRTDDFKSLPESSGVAKAREKRGDGNGGGRAKTPGSHAVPTAIARSARGLASALAVCDVVEIYDGEGLGAKRSTGAPRLPSPRSTRSPR